MQTSKRKGISTASAKAKGRRLQQWVRDKIIKVSPHLSLDDVRSTSMGAGGEDVQLSPLARESFPFSVECKSLKSMALYKWVDQAVENCPEGVEPLVIAKANGRQPVAIVDAEWFFKKLTK